MNLSPSSNLSLKRTTSPSPTPTKRKKLSKEELESREKERLEKLKVSFSLFFWYFLNILLENLALIYNEEVMTEFFQILNKNTASR